MPAAKSIATSFVAWWPHPSSDANPRTQSRCNPLIALFPLLYCSFSQRRPFLNTKILFYLFLSSRSASLAWLDVFRWSRSSGLVHVGLLRTRAGGIKLTHQSSRKTCRYRCSTKWYDRKDQKWNIHKRRDSKRVSAVAIGAKWTCATKRKRDSESDKILSSNCQVRER